MQNNQQYILVLFAVISILAIAPIAMPALSEHKPLFYILTIKYMDDYQGITIDKF